MKLVEIDEHDHIHSDQVCAALWLERIKVLRPEGEHGLVILSITAGGKEHYFALPQGELSTFASMADEAASRFKARPN